MNDWIEEAVNAIKDSRTREKESQERRVLDVRAIEIEMPRKWALLKDGLREAVGKFNARFSRDFSIGPIRFDRDFSDQVVIGMQEGPAGSTFHSITVSLVADRQEIECKSASLELIPDHIYFKVNSDGDVYLMARHAQNAWDIPTTVKFILQPLFSQVRL